MTKTPLISLLTFPWPFQILELATFLRAFHEDLLCVKANGLDVFISQIIIAMCVPIMHRALQ